MTSTPSSSTKSEPDPWWDQLFPQLPYQWSPPGNTQMLTLIGYDITCPKRLNKVAKVCLDYGVRTQNSFFECHLDALEFDDLWTTLLFLINPEEDKLVAYTIDAKSARKTRTAGQMVSPEQVICYLL